MTVCVAGACITCRHVFEFVHEKCGHTKVGILTSRKELQRGGTVHVEMRLCTWRCDCARGDATVHVEMRLCTWRCDCARGRYQESPWHLKIAYMCAFVVYVKYESLDVMSCIDDSARVCSQIIDVCICVYV